MPGVCAAHRPFRADQANTRQLQSAPEYDRIGRHRIRARLKHLEFGHFGDWKNIGEGVVELRIHTGPGYRIYVGREKRDMTIILWAGPKRTQARDVARARHYWADYRRRMK